METNDLISVLMGEYGPMFSTIEMWACINALGVKPYYEHNMRQWIITYGPNIIGCGKTIYEAVSSFYDAVCKKEVE